ncbi:hypothetical protein KCP73_02165 [Salmonella enterica subsp. enterica]|nr:hypothetical protein KCP73_02165 [Salmonella enterica subsp. enterica]
MVHIVPRMAGRNLRYLAGSRGSADWRVLFRSECCGGGGVFWEQYGAGWCGADADTCT